MATTASLSTLALGRGLVIAFYGDDFTGSTDVLEVLTSAGLRTVLFTEVPGPDRLKQFPGVQAVGLAGVSRSLDPAGMREALPPMFVALAALGAPLVHYKICSTFDSAPEVGSIGCAIELARAVFGTAPIPLVVGAPRLQRYSAFGNLFVTTEGTTYRLDRHPALSRHPVTPMTEADLLTHLGRQTDLRLALVDVRDTAASAERIAARFEELAHEGADVVLLDVVDEGSLTNVGRFLDSWVAERWAESRAPSLLVGSSGIEYAVTPQWRVAGSARDDVKAPGKTLVVSGSRSAATEAQVVFAVRSGFAEVPVRPADLVGPQADAGTRRVVSVAERLLAEGGNVVVHLTDDEPVQDAGGADLARGLGRIARALMETGDVSRLVVAGGDTSGYVASALGITALEMLLQLTPGAPLCRVYGDEAYLDGLEVCLKGGQIGAEDYFVRVAGLGPGGGSAGTAGNTGSISRGRVR